MSSLEESLPTTPQQISKGDAEEGSPSVHNDPVASLQHQQSLPEGGTRGWMTVLGGFLCIFCSSGSSQAFGVFQDYYLNNNLRNYSSSAISWIGSTQLFFLLFLAFPAGKLFDMGYFRHCIWFGSILYVFSTFMLSLTQEAQYYQVFLSQGVGLGVAGGLIFAPALSVISLYFKRKRSLAMGLAMTGSSLGAIIYPVMLNNLFNGRAGFAWGVRATAFMNLGILVVANILITGKVPEARRPVSKAAGFRTLLSDGPYMLYIAGNGLSFLGAFMPIFYIQLFAQLHNVSPKTTSYSISILNAGAFVGRLIPNFLADKLGAVHVLITCTIMAGALVFLMLEARTTGGTVAFALLYGFFQGSMISLQGPGSATFANDMNEIGVRIGFTTCVVGITCLIGSPISGALLQSHGGSYNWYPPIIFSAVTLLGGAFILSISSILRRQRRRATKSG